MEKLLASARVDSGIEKLPFADFDLSETVSNALLPFDSIFYEQELELTNDIQEGVWVHGSRAHLIHLVNILLDSAQKYSSTTSRTGISLRRRAEDCLRQSRPARYPHVHMVCYSTDGKSG